MSAVVSLDTRKRADELLADGAVTVKEAAAMASISVSSIYGAMERGELAYIKLGRARRVPRRAIVDWLSRNLTGGWAADGGDAK